MERLSPAAGQDPVAPAYERHRPEETVLYGVIQSELETFLAPVRDRPLPRFVEREFRGFLTCCILAHGFLRVRCDACGRDRIVAFSCNGRGFCPSCLARRMADTAAHLVDRVLPEAPVRQWVLTLPFALRYRLAYDAALTSVVLREFVRGAFASYRRRARERGPIRRRRGGAVTFIQRFGDALNQTCTSTPSCSTVSTSATASRACASGPCPLRTMTRYGESSSASPAESRVSWSAAASAGTPTPPMPTLWSPRSRPSQASPPVRSADWPPAAGARRGDRINPEDLSAPATPRCAAAMGFTLHADIAVLALDRRRLERLCRYVARPPVATDRLERLPDGRLLYHLRHRWRDGTTQIVFEPHQLLGRLVPLIPAPRAHQVRYHGVLAPCAGWRDRVVPAGSHPGEAAAPACCRNASSEETSLGAEGGDNAGFPGLSRAAPSTAPGLPDLPSTAHGSGRPPRRYPWAALLRRVFALDVLECPDRGGRMRILAAIHPPEATRAILECLGLPSRAPPTAPARPDPESPEPVPSD